MGDNSRKLVSADTLETMKDFNSLVFSYIRSSRQILNAHEVLSKRVTELEAENAALREKIDRLKRDDEWSNRVTYENVIEQIAACEDAKERDEARKLIEPLLKKSMVTHFRRDIKKRVKELNEDGGSTFNNYGTYTEVHSGGTNINNMGNGGN